MFQCEMVLHSETETVYRSDERELKRGNQKKQLKSLLLQRN